MKNNKKENITHLNTYSINKTLENIRNYKRKKTIRMRTSAILLSGVVLIGLASLPVLNNMQATERFQADHVQAAEELNYLENEKEQLAYQVGLLEDEEYIAKLARKELNLSKPNEILINIPEEEATDVETENEE